MLSPTDVHSCWEDMSYISAAVNTACCRFEPAGLLLVFQLFKVSTKTNECLCLQGQIFTIPTL